MKFPARLRIPCCVVAGCVLLGMKIRMMIDAGWASSRSSLLVSLLSQDMSVYNLLHIIFIGFIVAAGFVPMRLRSQTFLEFASLGFFNFYLGFFLSDTPFNHQPKFTWMSRASSDRDATLNDQSFGAFIVLVSLFHIGEYFFVLTVWPDNPSQRGNVDDVGSGGKAEDSTSVGMTERMTELRGSVSTRQHPTEASSCSRVSGLRCSTERGGFFDGYLLNNGLHYNITMLVAASEKAIRWIFARSNGQNVAALGFDPLMSFLGFALALFGLAVRWGAFRAAGRGFTHVISTHKRKTHKLVTHVWPYTWCRHPSYAGWTLWAVGKLPRGTTG